MELLCGGIPRVVMHITAHRLISYIPAMYTNASYIETDQTSVFHVSGGGGGVVTSDWTRPAIDIPTIQAITV